jgi:hypothetical protein
LWHATIDLYVAHVFFFSVHSFGLTHDLWHCSSLPHSTWQAMWSANILNSSKDAGIDIGHFMWHAIFWNGHFMACALHD